MEDEVIVELYWQRDETAIHETEVKYGRYLTKIACNILGSREDGQESVNDTYLKAWNSMPTNRPCALSLYLGKITRELSIDIYRKRKALKRKADEYAVSLSELEECAGGSSPIEAAELNSLAAAISAYLRTLTEEQRSIFVCRYFYMDSIGDISAYSGASASKVKSALFRARAGLREHLKKEGYDV